MAGEPRFDVAKQIGAHLFPAYKMPSPIFCAVSPAGFAPTPLSPWQSALRIFELREACTQFWNEQTGFSSRRKKTWVAPRGSPQYHGAVSAEAKIPSPVPTYVVRYHFRTFIFYISRIVSKQNTSKHCHYQYSLQERRPIRLIGVRCTYSNVLSQDILIGHFSCKEYWLPQCGW